MSSSKTRPPLDADQPRVRDFSPNLATLPAPTNRVRLVQKILPVSRGRLSVLVDNDDDGLDMAVAPPFPGRLTAYVLKGFKRPFCPSVLCSRQSEYFEDSFDAPFMVVTFPVDDRVVETIPAVVHVDRTARIQSVHPETNPLYSRLIEDFGKATSVPVLINTSLNISEQPTVNAPLEALHTYFCSGLDVLFLGPYRLSKAS